MSILQLDPQIPMTTPKGEGYAIAMLDYSQDHDILFVIVINETGEIWTLPNSQVRAVKNISMGRLCQDK
ncbi:MAG TPA: hypothetical protein VK590_04700 [Saprospiraceae bacterium]|nr:hypothetical protein [Saprospiraceae bacterium]